MIQHWDEDLIDSYLRDELSSEEKAELEALAENDVELQEKLYLDKLIVEALQDKDEKLKELQEWTITKTDKPVKVVPIWKKPIFIISTIAIAASILAGGFFLYPSKNETPKTTDISTTGQSMSNTVTAKADIKQDDEQTAANEIKREAKSVPSSSMTPSTPQKEELSQVLPKRDSNQPSEEANDVNNEFEPTETDAMMKTNENKRVVNKDRQLALQYKDYKAEFYALYSDSSVAEKQWREFMANPSNKKWDIVRATLDKKMKQVKEEQIVKKGKKDKNMTKY